jgi:hypothetical protein
MITGVEAKVELTLQQAMKAQRVLGARWGWVETATPRPLYPRGKEPDTRNTMYHEIHQVYHISATTFTVNTNYTKKNRED